VFHLDYVEENRFPREVRETRDFIFKIAYSSRAVRWATLRFSYEYRDRSGSEYDPNPYDAYYTSSLPGYIPFSSEGDVAHTLTDLRKYDLASHDKHTFNAKMNFILSERMDFAVSGILIRQDYKAEYGLLSADKSRINGELTWQPDTLSSFYAFASYDEADRDFASIRDKSASPDGNAGGAMYPLDNVWSMVTGEKGVSVGAGFKRQFGAWDIDINYIFADNKSRLDYSYATKGAIGGGISEEEAGSALPDQKFKMHSLNTELRWRIKEGLQVRFLYRLEHEDLSDYHFEGMDQPLIGNDLFLGAYPEKYTAHIFGLFFGVRY
jgi:hypothetical protein